MYKGYRNRLLSMDKTKKNVSSLSHINKCSKCKRLNPSLQPAEIKNVQNCLFCGNPFYIVKMDK